MTPWNCRSSRPIQSGHSHPGNTPPWGSTSSGYFLRSSASSLVSAVRYNSRCKLNHLVVTRLLLSSAGLILPAGPAIGTISNRSASGTAAAREQADADRRDRLCLRLRRGHVPAGPRIDTPPPGDGRRQRRRSGIGRGPFRATLWLMSLLSCCTHRPAAPPVVALKFQQS